LLGFIIFIIDSFIYDLSAHVNYHTVFKWVTFMLYELFYQDDIQIQSN